MMNGAIDQQSGSVSVLREKAWMDEERGADPNEVSRRTKKWRGGALPLLGH